MAAQMTTMVMQMSCPSCPKSSLLLQWMVWWRCYGGDGHVATTLMEACLEARASPFFIQALAARFKVSDAFHMEQVGGPFTKVARFDVAHPKKVNTRDQHGHPLYLPQTCIGRHSSYGLRLRCCSARWIRMDEEQNLMYQIFSLALWKNHRHKILHVSRM